jgi:hypothetical protein
LGDRGHLSSYPPIGRMAKKDPLIRISGMNSKPICETARSNPIAASQSPTPIESHRGLVVWQKAMDLAVFVFRITTYGEGFPDGDRDLLMLCARRTFVSNADAQPAFHLVTQISKMLTELRKRLGHKI